MIDINCNFSINEYDKNKITTIDKASLIRSKVITFDKVYLINAN